jgi:hypothetical protein
MSRMESRLVEDHARQNAFGWRRPPLRQAALRGQPSRQAHDPSEDRRHRDGRRPDPRPDAVNMGNFVFMNPHYLDGGSPDTKYDAVLRRETGHSFAVAAFGAAFGIADLIGENVVGTGAAAGAGDYGDQIAKSRADRPGRPTIPTWGWGSLGFLMTGNGRTTRPSSPRGHSAWGYRGHCSSRTVDRVLQV